MESNQENQEYIHQPPKQNSAGGKSGKTLAEKSRKKSKRHKQKIRFYYSFLTIVLLFCLIQVGFGVILNISKTIAYKSKINTMERVRDEAEQLNKDLKSDIKLFSKTSSLEEIARNNLKMAGEKEVLVIINNTSQPSGNPQNKNSKNKTKKQHKN